MKKRNTQKPNLRLVKKNKKRQKRIQSKKHKEKYKSKKQRERYQNKLKLEKGFTSDTIENGRINPSFGKEESDVFKDIHLESEVFPFPRTVEELRQNLEFFYMSFSLKEILEGKTQDCSTHLSSLENLRGDEKFLHVYSKKKGNCWINIEDISDISDIYTLTETGFDHEPEEVEIKSSVNQKGFYEDDETDDPSIFFRIPIDHEILDKRYKEWIQGGKSPSTFHGYFTSDEFIQYEPELEGCSRIETLSKFISMIRISDKVTRELMILTWGLFSGYQRNMDWTTTTKQKWTSVLGKHGHDPEQTQWTPKVEIRNKEVQILVPDKNREQIVILEMGDDLDDIYDRLDSLKVRGNMVGGTYVCLSDEQIKEIKSWLKEWDWSRDVTMRMSS